MSKHETASSGEVRGSGLWGTRRGGGGSRRGRDSAKRGLLALLALALAAPLAATAGSGSYSSSSRSHSYSSGYIAPSLREAAAQTPNASVPVIVLSDQSASRAENALEHVDGDASRRLTIVDGAAGKVRAGDLPELAHGSGLAIVPDEPVVLDGLGERDNGKPQWVRGRENRQHHSPRFSSGQLWTSAVGVDRLWPTLAALERRREPETRTSIAFVDSGIDAKRSDFGDRVLAQVDLTSLPQNSPGDGRGHGTFIAGLAAGSALGYAGAAPTAGIVSLDVMNDRGIARTSDVIAAAQWILKNRRQYGIRVANFSLHSATPSSFRWDPLDKALEKLWFSGVVVVTSSGNYGAKGRPTRVAFGPANDPFVITVGALDLRNSADPERASVTPWSVWGHTYDGFAKPELSAPGRALMGPIPVNSTLARDRPSRVVHTPSGAYMRLSGTSLAAPIVAGIAADILALHPNFTPDDVKGALMLSARKVGHAALPSAGVGEVFAMDAVGVTAPPNPNRALNAFLVADADDDDSRVFDDAAWLAAAKTSTSWDAASWLDGWSDAAWSLVSWSDVSWSDVSWSDVSWSDVSWSDVSWTDVSWSDVSWADTVYDDVD
jgi:serine protease AprX